MRKRFAPLALLFGLLTAMLLAGTSMAQANPDPSFDCDNAVNVVSCTLNGSPITVTITDNDVLSGNDFDTLENGLNVYIADILNNVNVQYIQGVVVNVYNNQFNPDITVGNVNVCIALCH